MFNNKNIRSLLKPLITAFIILFAKPQYWIRNDFILKIIERNREVGNISFPIAFVNCKLLSLYFTNNFIIFS